MVTHSPQMVQIHSTSVDVDVKVNGVSGTKLSQSAPAVKKRRDREAELDRWRPKVDYDLPSTSEKDVSSIILLADAREREIVSLDATELLQRIHSRTYTSEEVIRAHIHGAVAAQDLTNCVTEIFFDQAIERARELDHILDTTKQPVGPLHGLPVSIKDHIQVAGYDTASGYVAWAGNKEAKKDAVVVDVLRKAGAVLYVKTANPQTLLASTLSRLSSPPA